MASEGTAGGELALVELADLSDTGRVRRHNEDRSLSRPPVIAVADGMGGAKAGEVAAQLAVEEVARLPEPVAVADVRAAVGRANAAIRRMARDDPDKSGMGTTFTAAMLEDGRLDVVHVGDSRAYLWRDGRLRQLTEDHSVVAELVRRGSISPEDAETHPHRNVITRALGAEPEVAVDTFSEYLRDGDVVLLCSDGLSSYVSEEDITTALADAVTLADAAKALVERANGAGGTDNVTVVLARVGVVGDGASGSTAEVPVIDAPGAEPEPAATAELKVLGGVHGAAGRGGTGTSRRPRVLEPVKRRRRVRWTPVLAAAAVVVALAIGAVAWIASRSYVVEESPDGNVQVAHGLPFDVLGLDLSSSWQEIGVSAEAVRASEPEALSQGAQGQGEAVGDAAGLVWRYALPETPAVRTPARDTAPERPPAPAGQEQSPG
ncbi:MAG TPA: Stp1/IreP family PP2C-type Ser/Thr phosphatase [Miltoncostaeaceae bacterium]|jgi:protein phosphatase|nr:Stp1/IreP family PP2C-type Ser/Thr phosphatase [Miltoncostaeaceae bacterium]